jgi:hypothetical protein
MPRANEPMYPVAATEMVADELRQRVANDVCGNPSAWRHPLDAFQVAGCGLTIREHFAGLAMQAQMIVAGIHPEAFRRVAESLGLSVEQAVAGSAVEHADALITELEKAK